MNNDLLNHCLERLQEHPKRLTIHQPLDSRAKTSLTRYWAKSRFEVQQQSIIHLQPDSPLYGVGYLHHYELEWSEDAKDPSLWRLQITYKADPTLSPRELILLVAAGVKKLVETPFNRQLFDRTKIRMLGKDPERSGGAVLPALRPRVANVLFHNQNGKNYIRAWDMTIDITTED